MNKHPMYTGHAARAPLFVLLVVALTALGACESLGLVTPQTFTEKLAAGYIANTAVVNSATAALRSDAITVADAEQVLKLATESRKVLDAAKLAHEAGDVSTGEGRLALATSLLRELQTYLSTRKARP